MRIISESKKKNINRARELAIKLIGNRETFYSIDDYYTLQVSKFLLLKESIIKKNPTTNTIFFDANENFYYIKPIKKIVNYLKEHGKVVNNSVNVVITPKEEETDELKEVILTFHKLRDALAHGEYEIDIDNESIVIQNLDLTNNQYNMECSIPISLLEEFTYLGIPNNIINLLIKGEKTLLKCRYYEKPIIKVKEHIDSSFYNNVYKKEYYDFNSDNINKYYKSLSYEDSLKIVKDLLQFISESKTIKRETKNKAYKLAKKVINNPRFGKILNFFEKDIEYLNKVHELIGELANMLNLDNDLNSIKRIAIYNYIQMYLSNCFDPDDLEARKKMRYLRLSLIQAKFLTSRTDTNNPDNKIRNSIRYIMKQYEKQMNQCKKNPKATEYDYNRIIKDFYDSVINLFPLLEERNVSIITSIRNAVDHGNFSFDDNYINLKDTNDILTDKFECICESNQLFYIINDLDKTPINDLEYDNISIICDEIEPLFVTDEDKELYHKFNEAVRLYYRLRVINQLKEIGASK